MSFVRKKEIIWMDSLTYRLTMKKDLDPRSEHKTGTIRNPRQKLQLIHDPQCFQNPPIHSIYRKNPQSVHFLRPNLSIRKPIHPPHSSKNIRVSSHSFVHFTASFGLISFYLRLSQLTLYFCKGTVLWSTSRSSGYEGGE